MSRNKTIKLMHEMTGFQYSVCRKKLKENHWNLISALGYDQAVQIINDFVEDFAKSLKPAIDALVRSVEEISKAVCESISNMDVEAIANEYIRQNNIEALPVEISRETIGTEA